MHYNPRVKQGFRRGSLRLAACAALLAAVAGVDHRLNVNPTTVALTFLIAVLVISAYWGLALAIVMSLGSTLAFNYFFLPPTGTFTIAETQNWVALGAFLATALLASNLAERARREAAKAIAAEAARQSEGLRAALLDSVAHQFRTPLTSIKASATTLLSEVMLDESERSELLTVIDEEADRLNALVGAAARMAQLESSALELEIENVPATFIVNDALELAQEHLRQHKVSVDIPAGLPLLHVDRERMGEALRQVLENAAKYSPAGTEVRVTVRCEGNEVILNVGDAGCGLSQDEQRRAFDKFYRGASHRGGTAGSGMGLAIAKALVEAQGGRITIESAPQAGSIFSLRMPAAAAASAAASQAQRAFTPSSKSR